MSNQKYIILGSTLFIISIILDLNLVPYTYLMNFIGTGFALYGVINWLRIKENRIRFKEITKPKASFLEMIQNTFDFRWEKISIYWTICAVGAMLIVHLGSLMMSSSGAYKSAVVEIKNDSTIKNRTGGIVGFTYMVTGNFTTHGHSKLNIGVLGKSNSFFVDAEVFGENGDYETDKLTIVEDYNR